MQEAEAQAQREREQAADREARLALRERRIREAVRTASHAGPTCKTRQRGIDVSPHVCIAATHLRSANVIAAACFGHDIVIIANKQLATGSTCRQTTSP